MIPSKLPSGSLTISNQKQFRIFSFVLFVMFYLVALKLKDPNSLFILSTNKSYAWKLYFVSKSKDKSFPGLDFLRKNTN